MKDLTKLDREMIDEISYNLNRLREQAINEETTSKTFTVGINDEEDIWLEVKCDVEVEVHIDNYGVPYSDHRVAEIKSMTYFVYLNSLQDGIEDKPVQSDYANMLIEEARADAGI